MGALDLAGGLALPISTVTQTLGFMGKRGSGKSYGAIRLAESMLEAKARIVAIDPVGCWYSLRIGAGGKGTGFDIPVFGGQHGDLPLEPGAGALVVDRGISVVLDVSLMRKGQRKASRQAIGGKEHVSEARSGFPL